MSSIKNRVLVELIAIAAVAMLGFTMATFKLSEIISKLACERQESQIAEVFAFILIMGLAFGFLLWQLWRKRHNKDLLQINLESQYRFLFESNPHPMWVYDQKTLAFLAVNDAAINHYGYSREEFLRRTILDIRPPDDVSLLLEVISVSSPGVNIPGIWKHQKKDGTIIDVEIVFHTLTFSGKAARLVLANDVTNRLWAERALRASEEKYRTLFEASADAIFLQTLDGCILDGNTSASEIFGYSHEELIGLNLTDLFTKDTAEQVKALMAETLAEGCIFIEGISKNKNSTNFPCEVRVRLLKMCGMEMFIIYIRNISSRKQTEEKVFFQASILAQVRNAVIATDVEGKIIYWNKFAEKLYQWKSEEVIGKSIYAIAVPPNSQEEAQEIIAGLNKSLYWEGEFVVSRKDGSTFTAQVVDTVINDADGKPATFVGVSIDITERKQAEQALQLIVRGTASVTGDGFFYELVRYLALALKVRYALIGKVIDKTGDKIQTLAAWAGDEYCENFEYDLAGTPCENVVGQALRFYPCDVQSLFPLDSLLADMEVESYLGIPIFDSQGSKLGILLVMDDKEMAESPSVISILSIFATRAGAELERKAAEEKIEFQANILAQVKDAVIAVDNCDRITYWNQGAEFLYNLKIDEALGQPIDEVANYRWVKPEDERAASESLVATGLWKGEKIATRDSEEIYIESTISILKDSNANPDGFLYVCRDISPRKQAEEALRESEERFRQLAENIHEVFYLSDLRKPKIIYVSPAYEEIWGSTCESLYKQPTSFMDALHPEDRDRAIATFAQKLRREDCELEYRIVRPDGAIRWIWDRSFIICDEFNQPYRVCGIAQDITERKAAQAGLQKAYDALEIAVEQRTSELGSAIAQLGNQIAERKRIQKALHQSEKRYRAISELTSDYVYAVRIDPNGQLAVEWVTEAFNRITGYSLEEINTLGGWMRVIHPDDLEIGKVFCEAISSNQPFVGEYRIVRKDGEIRWLIDRAQPEWDASSSRLVGMIGGVQDITVRKHALQALRESEERLSALAKLVEDIAANIPGSVYRLAIKDNGNIELPFISAGTQELTGIAPKEAMADPSLLHTIIHSDDKEQFAQLTSVSLETLEPFRHEYRIITTSGQLKWVQDSARYYRTDKGDVVADGVVLDITPRKQAEEARWESEQRYQTLARVSPVGIFRSDVRGQTLYANERACEIAGRTPEQVLGGGWGQALHPDDRDRVFVLWEQAKKDNLLFQSEYRLLRPDGVQTWVLAQVAAEKGNDGEVIGYVGTITDISDRKQVEEEKILLIASLQESQERFRSAFEYTPIGMALVGCDGVWLQVNRSVCEILGYSEAELLTKTFQELTHPEDLDNNLDYKNKLLAGEIRTYQMEKRYIHKLGRIVWVLLSVSLVKNSEGKPLYFISQMQDISDAVAAATQRKQAEEERQKLVSLVENSADFIAMATFEGEPFYLNEAGRQLVGLDSVEEVLASSISDYLLPETWLQYRDVIIPAALQTGYWDGESQLRHFKTGRLIDVQMSLFIVRNPESGAPMCLATIQRDITERKQAEAALQESEARLQMALSCALMGTWDWNAIADEVKWSDSIEFLFGVNPGSLAGTYAAYLDCIHPEDRNCVEQAIALSLKEGRDYYVEHRIMWPDWTIRYVIAKGMVLRDATGRAVRMTGAIVDVTAARQAEDALKQQNERSRLIAEIAQRVRQSLNLTEILNKTVTEVRDFLEVERVAIYQIDVGFDGKFVVESVASGCSSLLGIALKDPCYSAGYIRKYQQGHVTAIADIYTAKLAPCYVDMLASIKIRANLIVPILLESELWGFLCAHECSSSRQWQQLEIDLLRQLSTQVAIAIKQSSLFQQLSARTAQLEAVNKELETFSYSVSHDLRAPLRRIEGFSKILQEDYAENLDETGKNYLQRVLSSTHRMGELIEDLLNLSKVTRTHFERSQVDLSTMARAIAADLQHRDPHRQVEFIIPDDLIAKADARLLQIVLENLLNNAWKYTSHHATARIEVGTWCHPAGYPVFFVSDDGAGFDMAYANKLFGAFQRLHSPNEFPGSGIGLATVQRIINRHGGRLWAESAVEQGATFYFTLK
jgi:PAS domain S-box-containing protein